MLVEEQIAARQERAKATPLKVLKRPEGGPFGDYTVKSASGQTYRVAVRGPGLFENYCSCPDFRSIRWEPASILKRCCFGFVNATKRSWRRRRTSESALPFRFSTGIQSRCGCACPPHPNRICAPSRQSILTPLACCAANASEIRRNAGSAAKADGQRSFIAMFWITLIGRTSYPRAWKGAQAAGEAQARPGSYCRRPESQAAALPGARRYLRGLPRTRGSGGRHGPGKDRASAGRSRVLAPEQGHRKGLVIAPASVKSQWKTEIEKFTDLSVQVIDGLLPRRKELTPHPRFSISSTMNWFLKDISICRR